MVVFGGAGDRVLEFGGGARLDVGVDDEGDHWRFLGVGEVGLVRLVGSAGVDDAELLHEAEGVEFEPVLADLSVAEANASSMASVDAATKTGR